MADAGAAARRSEPDDSKGGAKKGKKGGRGRPKSDGPDTVEANPADYVRIIPAGVAGPSGAPDESLGDTVLLSAKAKAPGLELAPDRLSVTGWKGYRSVRATHGAHGGTLYCEVTAAHLGATGHARLGWATAGAEVNAPVGYDACGYGLRDVDGSTVARAQRSEYGASFREGDVVGLLLHLPSSSGASGPRPFSSDGGSGAAGAAGAGAGAAAGGNLVRYKGELWREAPPADAPPPKPLPGSLIAFSVNGVSPGVAFADLPEGRYFPMVSLFTLPAQAEGASLAVNFGPDFKFPPSTSTWGGGGGDGAAGVPAAVPAAVVAAAEPLCVLAERARAAAAAEEAAAAGGLLAGAAAMDE